MFQSKLEGGFNGGRVSRNVPYSLSETKGHAEEEEPLRFGQILRLQRERLTGRRLLLLLRPLLSIRQGVVQVSKLLGTLQSKLLRRQFAAVNGFSRLDYAIVVAVAPYQHPAPHASLVCSALPRIEILGAIEKNAVIRVDVPSYEKELL